MRFMMIMRATAAGEAAAASGEGLTAAMTRYCDELAEAGVLLDAAGLQPSVAGGCVHIRGGQRRVVDGPLAEAQEPIAGYALIQVRDRAEALEWARRLPAPIEASAAAVLEVRPLLHRAAAGRH